MFIAFSIFLLVAGLIAFWLLVESKLRWYFKIGAIALFCLFTVSFYGAIPTMLGWSAMPDDLPNQVRLHWVVIKEPKPRITDPGRIYLLIERPRAKQEVRFLDMFSYEARKDDLRLFSIPYSRQLHEQLQEKVMPRLKDGQIVEGTIGKMEGPQGKGQGKGKGDGKGKGKGQPGDKNGKEGGKGDGDESQSHEQFYWHDLPPSDIRPKQP
jgi:hypothetical protein